MRCVSTTLTLILVLAICTSPSIAATAHGSSPRSEKQTLPYTPVVTPNGSTLPWKMEGGVKVFHLTIDQCRHEVAPGMVINAWCYNGQTPGPTIEAIEGDRVRFYVTNKLPEGTAVHWHGVLLPNGMDGVQGLTQPGIPPGKTYVYEFTLRQHGTQMYHSHGDEMIQIGLGTMGFFIIHPKKPEQPRVDRDFAILLSEWFVQPGSATPNAHVMTDFNLFTFNSRVFPGTDPLVVRKGDRVRIRFANVAQDVHAIHLHGHNFRVTATDGGEIPLSAQWPETTVTVAPGQTRDITFVADAPGDWALHCHLRHHPMNAMSHDFPVLIGVSQEGLEGQIGSQIPGYMAMGENGMEEHAQHAQHMGGPPNTLPMMGGQGQFGPIAMGGMFTVLKVRENLKSYEDPGWYEYPKGTVPWPVDLPQDAEGVPSGPASKETPASEHTSEHPKDSN